MAEAKDDPDGFNWNDPERYLFIPEGYKSKPIVLWGALATTIIGGIIAAIGSGIARTITAVAEMWVLVVDGVTSFVGTITDLVVGAGAANFNRAVANASGTVAGEGLLGFVMALSAVLALALAFYGIRWVVMRVVI